jgi:hypothetical protein
MIEKNRQFVVFLKDAGTSRVTRHRVKAPDPELAVRSFADRGLHTLGAEELWFHLTKRMGLVIGLLLVVVLAVYGIIEAANTISLYYL